MRMPTWNRVSAVGIRGVRQQFEHRFLLVGQSGPNHRRELNEIMHHDLIRDFEPGFTRLLLVHHSNLIGPFCLQNDPLEQVLQRVGREHAVRTKLTVPRSPEYPVLWLLVWPQHRPELVDEDALIGWKS